MKGSGLIRISSVFFSLTVAALLGGCRTQEPVRRSEPDPIPPRPPPAASPDRELSRAAPVEETADLPSPADALGKLEVHVIDVGQGDAILIRCPDGEHELVIDAADNRYPNSGKQFKDYLGNLLSIGGVTEIEVVIASHPHADHIGNMAWLLRHGGVGLYVDNGKNCETTTCGRVKEALLAVETGHQNAQEDPIPNIDFCPRADVNARILRPLNFGRHPDPNNNSVVVRVDYGEDSFLFVGDAEADEERLLLEDPGVKPLLDCDFLKAAHHGSNTSSTPAFLDVVSPEIVAVSCGAKGVGTNAGYKHPRLETVQALLGRAGAREGSSVTMEAFETADGSWKAITLDRAVYVTTAEGDLVFESDGHGIHRRRPEVARRAVPPAPVADTELIETKQALAEAKEELAKAAGTIDSLRRELAQARAAAAAPPVVPPVLQRGPPPTEQTQAATVYVTRTGKKYHRSGCQYLRQSRIPMALNDARRAYSPCSVCGPP